jgi:hypothetical protein
MLHMKEIIDILLSYEKVWLLAMYMYENIWSRVMCDQELDVNKIMV